MAMVMTDFGGSYILNQFFGGGVDHPPETSFIVQLYTNTGASALDDGSVEADVVEPVSAGTPVCGYETIAFDAATIAAASLSSPGDVPYVTLSPSAWTGGGNVGSQTGPLVWKFTGATSLPVQGYTVVGGDSMTLFWYEPLPSPWQPNSPGDELKIIPKFMLGKATAEDLATIIA